MPKWPHDDMASKIAFYGDPRGSNHRGSPQWEKANLISIQPPFQIYYAKKPIKRITCHKKVADAMMAAFNEIWDKCGHDQKTVDKTGASDYAGCYNPRVIAGSAGKLSNHSWACAIDLAPATNGFNMKGTLPKLVVDAFKRQGALWGGDYKWRKDPMHFEFVSR